MFSSLLLFKSIGACEILIRYDDNDNIVETHTHKIRCSTRHRWYKNKIGARQPHQSCEIDRIGTIRETCLQLVLQLFVRWFCLEVLLWHKQINVSWSETGGLRRILRVQWALSFLVLLLFGIICLLSSIKIGLGDCNCGSKGYCEENNSPLCPPGEVFIHGASACDTTCATLKTFCSIRPFAPVNGCFCPDGYARLSTNDCVLKDSPACINEIDERAFSATWKPAQCSECSALGV